MHEGIPLVESNNIENTQEYNPNYQTTRGKMVDISKIYGVDDDGSVHEHGMTTETILGKIPKVKSWSQHTSCCPRMR